MDGLYKLLMDCFKEAKGLAILGVGSFLKSDDAAGVIITEKLREHFSDVELSSVNIFTGESAPENYTGKIKKAAPSHLLIIDAADMKTEPGSIQLIQPDEIEEASFTTHMLPLKIMLGYLSEEIKCCFTIIGIQPEDLTFAGEVTPKVSDSIDYITSAIERMIEQLEQMSDCSNNRVV